MKTAAARFIVAGLAFVTLPLSAAAQQPPYAGAFARNHPDAARLVHASDVAYWAMLDRLFEEGVGAAEPLDASVLQRNPATRLAPVSIRVAMPRLAAEAPLLLDIVDRTLSLRDEIYDIRADVSLSAREEAVEAAVDRYLAGGGGVLPAIPKSLASGSAGAGFDERSPGSSGIAHAFIWLQLAAFDALLYHPSPAERLAGMDLVVERFREKLTTPGAAPTVMPTAPAISPELVREHPRAAIILGNLHLLQEGLADALIDPQVRDRRRAVEEAVARAIDPSWLTLSESEWMLSSLRMGIYFQGGPAVGSLARSERNVDGSHTMHRTTILPGMGSGPDGEVALPGSLETPPEHQH